MEFVRVLEFGVFSIAATGILLGALLITEEPPGSPKPVTASLYAAVSEDTAHALPPAPPTVNYIEVRDSCGPHYENDCIVARAEPSEDSPIRARLRTGVVLEVASTTVESAGAEWYRVTFSEWMRYPYRIEGEWYVRSDLVRHFSDPGPLYLEGLPPTTTKRIIINRTEQKLYAYDGNKLFLAVPISTGRDLTPTPRGTFTVFRKTPSRYMQGPLPGISDQYYDLPGVPWSMYFTEEGGAIHGAYWHDSFGMQWSHGCVNLPLIAAEKLYQWTPIGTPVTVRD